MLLGLDVCDGLLSLSVEPEHQGSAASFGSTVLNRGISLSSNIAGAAGHLVLYEWTNLEAKNQDCSGA